MILLFYYPDKKEFHLYDKEKKVYPIECWPQLKLFIKNNKVIYVVHAEVIDGDKIIESFDDFLYSSADDESMNKKVFLRSLLKGKLNLKDGDFSAILHDQYTFVPINNFNDFINKHTKIRDLIKNRKLEVVSSNQRDEIMSSKKEDNKNSKKGSIIIDASVEDFINGEAGEDDDILNIDLGGATGRDDTEEQKIIKRLGIRE